MAKKGPKKVAAAKTPNPCFGAPLAKLPQPATEYSVPYPFSPSVKQLTGYAKSQKHALVVDRRETPPKITFDDKAIVKLAGKYRTDPLYPLLKDYKRVERCKSTYVDGILPFIKEDGRLLGEFTHNPLTLRLSQKAPTLMNLPRIDSADKENVYNWVRAMYVAAPGHVLAARDFCVSPATRILRADLTWGAADTVRIGDELIGFDESFGKLVGLGKGQRRGNKFRKTRVVAVKRIVRPTVRVKTTLGETVVSSDHRFVARKPGQRRNWVEAQHLRPGMLMPFLASPWETDATHSGGYLAGFLDGEGYCHRTNVGFGQNSGDVLAHTLELLHAKGFTFTQHGRGILYPPTGHVSFQYVCVSGIGNQMRLLGTLRPRRLLAKSEMLWEGRGISGKCSQLAEVLSVEVIESAGEVIAIETTAGTFISDGFFSHNCGIEAKIVGYLANDPAYTRICSIDPHSYLVSHLIGQPADLSWSDAELGRYLGEIKRNHKAKRQSAKKVQHAANYLATAHKTYIEEPELFGSEREAVRQMKVYADLWPKIGDWHTRTVEECDRRGFVKAPSGFRLHYVDVYKWTSRVKVLDNGSKYKVWDKEFGEAAKEAVAGGPQHMGAVYLMTAAVALCEEYPEFAGMLRLLLHDEIFWECREEDVDLWDARVKEAMERPLACMPLPPSWGMGEYMRVETEGKRSVVSKDGVWGRWSEMVEAA